MGHSHLSTSDNSLTAQVFVRSGSDWALEDTTSMKSSKFDGQEFDMAVAVEGDGLVVGASGTDADLGRFLLPGKFVNVL